ncbi:MAG: ATP-binding cassette domain-containing protein [Candidatus Aminicenantes bacterium]|nr:ATP-binding cassette domain-containing protein [Candidatus Aminicenantes bacterium]
MKVIETHNLTKYYGKSRGIVDLNLEVEEGEIFGFIGPNGAGKSTAIRTLLGLIFPTSGKGYVFGKDIVKDSKEIKKHIGFMPSDVNYYEKMDVAELLRYSADFYDVDCDARIRELADTFALDLNRKILELSQGNKKKVSILQSLIHRPTLLILDEPTSGLDPLMQSKFFDILKHENQEGTTVFFSSHTLSEVQQMCKRVGIIREGKIIAVEDIDSLRKKQLRKIRIEFAHAPEGAKFKCLGMLSPKIQGNELHFMYAGIIEDLIKALASEKVADLLIEEPTLEEIFLHYYDETNGTSEEPPNQ